jgi:hypothetical protein
MVVSKAVARAAAKKATAAKITPKKPAVAVPVKKAAATVKATAARQADQMKTLVKASARRAAAPAVPVPVKAPATKPVALPAPKKPVAPVVPAVKKPVTPVTLTPAIAPVKKVAGITLPPVKKVAAPVVKPAVAPVVKAPKAPKVKKQTPRSLIVDMLFERKWTDDEILAAVVAQFGTGLYTTNKAYVQLTRSDLNGGWIKSVLIDGRLTRYIGMITIDEKGKRVEQPYKPSNNRKKELMFPID